MSAEKPSIAQVKNDVIQVRLPYLAGTKNSFLTASSSASGTTLTPKDNSDFIQNEYLVIGNSGVEQTEIKRITGAVTPGSTLTVAALTFDHPTGTLITKSAYDQVEIYGSASASDAAPTLIGSAVSIDAAHGFNEIKAVTTYAYYYARYKDSNAGTYSEYSDAVASGGLTSTSRGEIKKEFLSIYNERLDDLITDDWLNRAINRWQRELEKRKKTWSCLRSSSISTLVQDKQGYDLPDTIKDIQTRDSIISIKIKDQRELTYIDQEIFSNFTSDHVGSTLAADIAIIDTSFTLTSSKDFAAPTSGNSTIHIAGDEITYTTNTKATNILSGGGSVTSIHSSGDEVWQTYVSGQSNRYTIDNGKVKLFPIPDSTLANYNLYIEFWKKFSDLSSDSDETVFIYPENCYLYLNWQLSIRKKQPVQEQQLKRAVWISELEELVANDSEFRDLRLDIHNMYANPY